MADDEDRNERDQLIGEINVVLRCLTRHQLVKVLGTVMLMEGSLPPDDRKTVETALAEAEDHDCGTVEEIREVMDQWVEWGAAEKLPNGRYRLIPEKEAWLDAKLKARGQGWDLHER